MFNLLSQKLTNFYAYKKDPIQYYFKEKFEITSASKEAQKIIMKSNINVYHSPENRSTIFKRLIRGFDLIPEESNENENPNNYQMHLPNNRYSFSKKKKLRQERLKLLQEIQKKKKEEIIDMSKLMTNFLEKSKINDDVVCNDLRKQMENITLKVNHRKMSVSLNLTNCNSSTSFRFGGNEPSEISIYYSKFF